MANVSEIRSRILSVRGPGIAKVSSSRAALCESRAASMYGEAVDATGGNRNAARIGECDERTIRDRRTAARGIAFADLLLTLNRDGLYRVAEMLCDYADEQGSKDGTHG
jgi:hypothetical protein